MMSWDVFTKGAQLYLAIGTLLYVFAVFVTVYKEGWRSVWNTRKPFGWELSLLIAVYFAFLLLWPFWSVVCIASWIGIGWKKLFGRRQWYS